MIGAPSIAVYDGVGLSVLLFGEKLDPRTYLSRMYPDMKLPSVDIVSSDGGPMIARVNHGIWIASCECGLPGMPSPGCVVFFDNPIGYDIRCRNEAWAGSWRRIAVPDQVTRHQIEAILLSRPNVSDQNWEPYETVGDLIAQNQAHGDPVPNMSDLPVAIVSSDEAGIVQPFPQEYRQRYGAQWWRRFLPRRGKS